MPEKKVYPLRVEVEKENQEVFIPDSYESNKKSRKILTNILEVLSSIVIVSGSILVVWYLDRTAEEEKPEGRPKASREVTLNNYKGFERAEDSLTAGFKTKVTYIKVDSRIPSFTILPYAGRNLNLDDLKVAKKHEKVLSTSGIVEQDLESLNLQEILKKNCTKLKIGSRNIYAIKPEQLPVIFDSKIIRLDLTDGAYLTCEGSKNSDCADFQDYINIQYYQVGGSTEVQHMFMYDDSSQELGHGSPPFMRRYGEKIEGHNSSDIELFIFVHFFDVGPTLTDRTWIRIRGIKSYRINGKTIFYISKDISVMDSTDSRLRNIVEKYGKPVTQKAIMGDKLSDYADKKMFDQADEKTMIREIISEFFKEMDHLESPYKERVQRLEKDLNAVSLK